MYHYLQQYFQYDQFHEGQEEIISDVLDKKDVLGILRTGTGKSLCYQLPAKMLPGITIVVSPLISLMIDQVRELQSIHYKEVVALHSFQTWKERQTALEQLHTYKLVYVSPEILQSSQLIHRLRQLTISLFVVDEAHCISQWGYDFRPDYLRLPETLVNLGEPPVLALTGTATPEVQQDIQHKLKRHNMVKHIYPMDRENISLVVEEVVGNEDEKVSHLLSWISENTSSTIVYFSSRAISEKLAHQISTKLPDKRVAYYHGGLDTMDRLKIQQQFMNEQLDVICCTSAFGMGINKPDIRMIIHYHMPTQIESYIQEIGRAGRDGNESVSVLLFRREEIKIPLNIIENELPTPNELKYMYDQLLTYQINREILPTNDTLIEQLFLVNITKWRYILYLLERYQIVVNNFIIGDENNLQDVFRKIKQFTEKRLQYKKQHLQQVIDWVFTKKCLRQELYAPFEQQIQAKETNCCSNCGFVLDESLQQERAVDFDEETDWQSLLKQVLLIGDKS